MKPHKWAKEIVGWANGATIQFSSEFGVWIDIENHVQPEWNEYTEYRIKPQPKEPQYLYVCLNDADEITFETKKDTFGIDNDLVTYIGKIKLEDESE
jgi:hypothetical protein